VTVVVSGLDDEPEGPRTRVSFRCTMHVEESGSDWANSLTRAKEAFAGTHPVEQDLFDWSMSDRMDQRIVSLETVLIDDLCRISASLRSRTICELVFDATLILECDEEVFGLDTIAELARGAVDDLFDRDAVELAAHSPGRGLVLASATIDTMEQTLLERIGERRDGGA
jgi:hypothetical protein